MSSRQEFCETRVQFLGAVNSIEGEARGRGEDWVKTGRVKTSRTGEVRG